MGREGNEIKGKGKSEKRKGKEKRVKNVTKGYKRE